MFESSILKVAVNGQGVVGRRSFLRGIGLGAAGLAGLSFTDLMAVQADELRKRQMACILLWMGGGPSQLDTWDPKPRTETGGETRAIATAVPGIQIAHHFPRRRQGDEGRRPDPVDDQQGRQPPAGDLPAPHRLCPVGDGQAPELRQRRGRRAGRPQVRPAAHRLHRPATTRPARASSASSTRRSGSPTRSSRRSTPSWPVPTGRFVRRLNLMHSLEVGGFGNSGGLDRVQEHHDIYKQTASMVLSPHMKAFDVESEDPKTRAAYGETPFGQGCLLARRLVQAGVTFVEVRSGGWDNHAKVNDSVAKNAASVDPGFGSLIADLKSRGMLDRTLVVWMGEFGRTPKINPDAGRDHFPRVFSVAMAGGGVKGGQVIGSSTPDGTGVKDRPVAVVDLMASFCKSLKIDPKKENISPQGRPIKIVNGGKPVKELFA